MSPLISNDTTPWKAVLSIEFKDDGRVISLNNKHPLNAEGEIEVNKSVLKTIFSK